MFRLEVWVDETNTGLCDRVEKALALNPPGLGVELQGVAITGDGKYRNFVAKVQYPEFLAGLRKGLKSVEGIWINEYPPGVEEQLKAGTIWTPADEADQLALPAGDTLPQSAES